MEQRQADWPVEDVFVERWSPRAFSDKPVNDSVLMSIFEAARFTPSCYNEQPWEFFYAKAGSDSHSRFVETLVKQNQVWAVNSPVLAYIVCRLNFIETGKTNSWAVFDSGAAWMSLTMQGRFLGVYTHGMAGFSQSKAMDFLGLDKDAYRVCAAIAIGYLGDRELLPDQLKEREFPSGRRKVDEFVRKIL